MDFYQGNSFGYIVNQYQGTAVIRIISLDHVQAEIEHQKYCAKNPSNCDI
jgi:peptide methionine sulfoxide reductase MsrA